MKIPTALIPELNAGAEMQRVPVFPMDRDTLQALKEHYEALDLQKEMAEDTDNFYYNTMTEQWKDNRNFNAWLRQKRIFRNSMPD
jgi:hypothetical protein